VDLDDDRPIGYEALTRFDDGVAPDRRIAELAGAGGGIELEMLLTRAGVRAAEVIPPDTWLALNVSVDLIEAGQALRHILEPSLRHVVLEIRASDLRDPEGFTETLAALPGVSVSLTGVEASYDSLTLVRDIGPRFVKLERSWLAQLATDPARQALITALLAFSADSGPQVIAEGIESSEELDVLRRLGVRLGQGFLLGRPSSRPAAVLGPNEALVNTAHLAG
jgi:EAL domain-containing protein (putative c-di-GMP-specific phosphodiesterase class I)